MRTLHGITAAWLLVCLAAAPAHAQSQATTAQITGQVTDTQGGVLPGVTVTVTNPETAFTRRVHSVVRRVPVGRVITYGDVARLAGRPGAARAVGTIMKRARARGLPYHRVIAAGGLLGGFGGNLALKRALLVAEGLEVSRTRVKGFDRVRWP